MSESEVSKGTAIENNLALGMTVTNLLDLFSVYIVGRRFIGLSNLHNLVRYASNCVRI